MGMSEKDSGIIKTKTLKEVVKERGWEWKKYDGIIINKNIKISSKIKRG